MSTQPEAALATLQRERRARRTSASSAALSTGKPARAGFSGQRLDDLVLAVDEAATNIILHGYGEHSDSTAAVIVVEVAFRHGALSVCLRDQARPFDPTAAPVVDELPPLTERGPGGLGIFLIRKTMDEFRYQRTSDGWNELTLLIYGPPDIQEY